MLPDDIRDMIEQKMVLDSSPDDDGTKTVKEQKLKSAIRHNLAREIKSVAKKADVPYTLPEIYAKVDEALIQLADEKNAVEETQITAEARKKVEAKIENEIFTNLVDSYVNQEKHLDESVEEIIGPSENEADQNFKDLAKEEKVIEELEDVDEKTKQGIEENLENDLLGEVPALNAEDEKVESATPSKIVQEIGQVVQEFKDEKEVIENLDVDTEVRSELKHNLVEDTIAQIEEKHEETDDTPGFVREEAKMVAQEELEKLDKGKEFVENLKDMEVIGTDDQKEGVEQELKFNALNKVADVIEDTVDKEEIKDDKNLQDEVENMALVKEMNQKVIDQTDLDPLEKEEEKAKISDKTVLETVDVLTEDNPDEPKEEKSVGSKDDDQPKETAADLVVDLIKKQVAVEKTKHFDESEKESINMELEEQVVGKIAEKVIEEEQESVSSLEAMVGKGQPIVTRTKRQALSSHPDSVKLNLQDEKKSINIGAADPVGTQRGSWVKESKTMWTSKGEGNPAAAVPEAPIESIKKLILHSNEPVTLTKTESRPDPRDEESEEDDDFPLSKTEEAVDKVYDTIDRVQEEKEIVLDSERDPGMKEKITKKLDAKIELAVSDLTSKMVKGEVAKSNPEAIEIAEELRDIAAAKKSDMAAVVKSDLKPQEKLSIETKVEDGYVSQVVEEIEDIKEPIPMQMGDSNLKEALADKVEEVIEDVDLKKEELAENPLITDDVKLETEVKLEQETEDRIMDDMQNIKEILHTGDELPKKVKPSTKKEVKELLNELTEDKALVETANMTKVEKSAIESKLNEDFVGTVIDIVEEEVEKEAFGQDTITKEDAAKEMKDMISDFTDEKFNIESKDFKIAGEKELASETVNKEFVQDVVDVAVDLVASEAQESNNRDNDGIPDIGDEAALEEVKEEVIKEAGKYLSTEYNTHSDHD